jgi:hypothetical protein
MVGFTERNKVNKTNDDFIVQNQLNIMNDCFNCLQLDDLCPECLDTKEAQDSVIAHQLVDEGSEIYSHILSRLSDEPSAHDWVSNETVTSVEEPTLSNWDRTQGEPIYTIRREQKEQIYDINNRLPGWLFLGQHIYPLLAQDELDAYLALPSTDVICVSCHLQINRFVGCLNH